MLLDTEVHGANNLCPNFFLRIQPVRFRSSVFGFLSYGIF